MLEYFTLDNFNFKGKTVGIRVDINSPLINNKIVLNERITKSLISIKELISNGAKIVILAHQGRKGKPDFVSLKEHCDLLSKELNLKIEFFNDIFNKDIKKKIENLNNGEVILLENLRFFDDELNPKKKNNKILKLQNLFDFYVFDAFSVAHREQTSIIGFDKIINIAGRLMEKELNGLSSISKTKRPKAYIFGGAKPDDLINLIELSLENELVDLVILTGVIGEISLYLNGYDLGKKLDFLKDKNYLNSIDKIKKVITKFKDKIVLPKDIALFDGKKRIEIPIEKFKENKKLLDKYLIEDIGKKTIINISSVLKGVNSIYLKGPPGNFENKNFEFGTKNLLNLIVKSNTFTYMGGGHSVTSATMFGVLNKFSYVSLAGGALVKFLSGEKLVGVEVLNNSFNKFKNYSFDFVIVGSNSVDNCLYVDKYLTELNLGDKIKITDDFKTKIGGGGVNVSISFSRLGSKVGYLGKFSKENYPLIKDFLNNNKVNLIETKLSKRAAAKSIILDTKDKDRVIFTYRGQNPYLEYDDFDKDKFVAENYYFNSLTKQSFETLCKFTKFIKKRNKTAKICYNPSSYLIRREPEKLKNFIKDIDILILNLEESEIFTKKDKITDCLTEIYNFGVKIVIITDGTNGSFCFDGKKEYFQKPYLIKKVIDTTGAGDAFASTFFYFYSKGFEIKKSLYYASKNASFVISKKGATDGLAYYKDLIE